MSRPITPNPPNLPEDPAAGGQPTELDLYLDGALSAQAAADFERRMLADPQLHDQVLRQREIDQALRADLKYEWPRPASRPAFVASPAAERRRIKPRWVWAIVGIAAAVLLFTLAPQMNIGPNADFRQLDPARTYAWMESRDFFPYYKCETDELFAQAVKNRLGESILIPLETPGVEIIGWNYGNEGEGFPMDRNSMILLTRVHADDGDATTQDERGTGVIVVFAPASADRGWTLSDPRLHMFRRQIGKVVMYEISPLAKPTVLMHAVAFAG